LKRRDLGKTMTKLDRRRRRRKERITRFGRKMEKSKKKRKIILEAVYCRKFID
jgi:hypothetical protein